MTALTRYTLANASSNPWYCNCNYICCDCKPISCNCNYICYDCKPVCYICNSIWYDCKPICCICNYICYECKPVWYDCNAKLYKCFMNVKSYSVILKKFWYGGPWQLNWLNPKWLQQFPNLFIFQFIKFFIDVWDWICEFGQFFSLL